MLFRRAVGNVLDNALRHTSGGRVPMTMRGPDRGWVELAVRDNGSGIAPEGLPRVFDRFFRSTRAVLRKDRGMGPGLATVRSILRLHGGTVTVDSRLGQGTSVVLRFPATPGPCLARCSLSQVIWGGHPFRAGCPAGGVGCLLAIFLPGWLLIAGTLPF